MTSLYALCEEWQGLTKAWIDAPEAAKAVRRAMIAVVTLHARCLCQDHDDEDDGPYCQECQCRYPCATVIALGGASA